MVRSGTSSAAAALIPNIPGREPEQRSDTRTIRLDQWSNVMVFSPRRLLRLVSGLLLLLASTHLSAQAQRHTIIVLDLGLPANELARASELSRELASHVPVDHHLALVGADEIVHHLIEPVSGPSFAVEFDAIASELTTREFSSYSSGLERAVALARETGLPGNLLLFSNGVIAASDPSRQGRYQQWAESILMPDAASIDMRVIFASATPLQDSLIAALQQASSANLQLDFTAVDASAIGQLLLDPAAGPIASNTDSMVLAETDSTAEQQAAEEKARAEQLAAEQQAAEENARAEQLAAEQQATEEKAPAEQLAAEQQAAETQAADTAAVATTNTTTTTSPAISITAAPANRDSGTTTWIAIGAGILALLIGLAGWLLARRRSAGTDSATAASTPADRQAAYDDIKNSGEATLVKSPAAAAPKPAPQPEPQAAPATVTTHDAATMINPATAANAATANDDYATRVNTDSHAFRDDTVKADEPATAVNAAPLASVSPDEPTVATGKPTVESTVAAPLTEKPLPNPADEFAVFENSISAKRATGKESAEQRKSASMAALTRDRTFDPALDTESDDK
jgi:hypothetical protein